MPTKPKKILIAEDEKALARVMELKLTNAGYEVSVVHDGQAAIEALKKGKFNLLLLDLVMPKVDGFGVLAEMKAKKNKTPILVSSNLSQDEDVAKAKSFGIKDYFIKSNTSVAEVVSHVKKLL